MFERVKSLINRRRLDRDLDDEIAFHLAMRAEREGATGARRRFGNATHIRETCRDLWTFGWVERLGQDLRYALRTLRATPAFTTIAVLSLALGIGANAALFSVMDVMLLRALPVRHPEQLVEFVRAHPDGAMMTNIDQEVFDFFQRGGAAALSEVLAVSPSWDVFRAGGPPLRINTHEVSGSFFPMLGVEPLLGRAIGADDDRAGPGSRVAVLSYGFWGRQFGRDPRVLGQRVRLTDEAFTIVGVMPAEFFGIDRANVPDLWVPFARDPNSRYAWILGRLRPGVSPEGARVALEPVFKRALESLAPRFGASNERDRKAFLAQRLVVNRAAEGTSILRWSYWTYHSTLKILASLTGLVLLIACANLANLLTARSAGRAREIGIRLAVGAGRWRVARQLLTESLLLSLAGAALGVAVAGWGHRLLLGFLMREPAAAALDYRIDYRLLAFGFAAAVATALIFGLLPAIRATRTDVSSAMHPGGRGAGALRLPTAKLLLTAQVALSMVLLVGAGLFARSLRNLGTADLGFARENLLLVDVRPSTRAPEGRRQFWMELADRVRRLPGVRGDALAGDAAFGNGGWRQTVWIEQPGQAAQWMNVADNLVGAGFFATTGIPLLQGREFGEQDREGAPLVVVVNRTFAARAFAGANPIGRRIGDRGAASAGRYEIVGVVGDAKYGAVREKQLPMVFHPMAQAPPRASCVLHVRTVAPPQDVAAAVRAELLAADSAALIGEARTVPQILHSQLREDRMFASLAAFFAGLALALGAIGIYGVLAYRVSRRTAEIGVRMALGARRVDVLWLVLRETATLLAVGIVVGAPAAVVAARLVKSVLFGIEPLDPPALAGAALLLAAAGCLAGYLPARRAASIEPTVALRAD